MTERKRLILDVDEVLADFQTPVLAEAARLFGKQLTPHDFDSWDLFAYFSKVERVVLFEALKVPGFCSTFVPKDGAVEAVQELREIVDITVVTRPFAPSPTWAWDRVRWLMDVFGFLEDDILSGKSKHYVDGDGIVDDNPEHVSRWLQKYPERAGMLWHIPNTRNMTQYDHLRVYSWDQVIERAKAL